MSILNKLLTYQQDVQEAIAKAILNRFGYPNEVVIHTVQGLPLVTEWRNGYEMICRVKLDPTMNGLNISIQTNYPEIIEAVQNVNSH